MARNRKTHQATGPPTIEKGLVNRLGKARENRFMGRKFSDRLVTLNRVLPLPKVTNPLLETSLRGMTQAKRVSLMLLRCHTRWENRLHIRPGTMQRILRIPHTAIV